MRPIVRSCLVVVLSLGLVSDSNPSRVESRRTPLVAVPVGSSKPLVLGASQLEAELLSYGVVAGSVAVTVVIDPAAFGGLSDQGYRIVGGTAGVRIESAATSGAVNGVHRLRRELMMAAIKNPLNSVHDPWNIQTVPRMKERSLLVGLYPFGGQQGLPGLDMRTWEFEQWRELVDALRLWNITDLKLLVWDLYHPDFPETHDELSRYAVYRRVRDHCRRNGIGFALCLPFNHVTRPLFWPDRHLGVEGNDSWHGAGLSLNKPGSWARLSELLQPTYDYFFKGGLGADELVVLLNDGGSMDYGPLTLQDPVRYAMSGIKFAREKLRQAGSNARVTILNFSGEAWFQLFAPDAVADPTNRHLITYAADLRRALLAEHGSSLRYADITYAHAWAQFVPGDPLGAAVSEGFGVTAFAWTPYVEEGGNKFPAPYVGRTKSIIDGALASGADGVTGYALSTPGRIVHCLATLALAERDLPVSEALSEVAAFLCLGDSSLAPRLSEILGLLSSGRTPPYDYRDVDAAISLFAHFPDHDLPSRHLQEYTDLLRMLFTLLLAKHHPAELHDPLYPPGTPFPSRLERAEDVSRLARERPVLRGFGNAWVVEADRVARQHLRDAFESIYY